MVATSTSNSVQTVDVLVFRRLSGNLLESFHQATGGARPSRCFCVLPPGADSSAVQCFWDTQVDPAFPDSALVILHEPAGRYAGCLLEIASVLREKNPEALIRMAVQFAPSNPLGHLSLAAKLPLIRKAALTDVGNCMIVPI